MAAQAAINRLPSLLKLISNSSDALDKPDLEDSGTLTIAMAKQFVDKPDLEDSATQTTQLGINLAGDQPSMEQINKKRKSYSALSAGGLFLDEDQMIKTWFGGVRLAHRKRFFHLVAAAKRSVGSRGLRDLYSLSRFRSRSPSSMAAQAALDKPDREDSGTVTIAMTKPVMISQFVDKPDLEDSATRTTQLGVNLAGDQPSMEQINKRRKRYSAFASPSSRKRIRF